MIVNKRNFSDAQQKGASSLEVLLAIAVVAIAAPFVYQKISATNTRIYNMRVARDIVSLRDPVLNFVRMNQELWPDNAQIKMSDEDMAQIADINAVGFIDKYTVRGAIITDVYLCFDLDMDAVRVADVVSQIGMDAAIVGNDGIAYGDGFAVVAPDFRPGNLVYRITHDFSDVNMANFLHRATSGEDDLNVMQRDLNMGGNDMLDIGTVFAKSARIENATAAFAASDSVTATNVHFSAGANIDGQRVQIGDLRVLGDVVGFRNIYAGELNGHNYTTQGRVISDRATVTGSVNVSGDLTIKSDTTRTISGFSAITTNAVATTYLSAEQIVFHENFGLTVSGELLMSTTRPIKIGNWTFPSTTPPRFSELTLSRARMPQIPDKDEFGLLMMSGWKTIGGVR